MKRFEFNEDVRVLEVRVYVEFRVIEVRVYVEFRVYVEVRVCLLYTSPSPRDQRGSRMPSSA